MTWGLCFLSSTLATSQPHVATEIYICQNQIQLKIHFPLSYCQHSVVIITTVVVPMATILKKYLEFKEKRKMVYTVRWLLCTFSKLRKSHCILSWSWICGGAKCEGGLGFTTSSKQWIPLPKERLRAISWSGSRLLSNGQRA